MDSDGNIYRLTEVERKDLEAKVGELVEIPDGDLARVKAMSRKERRARYAEQRRSKRRERRKEGRAQR